MVFTFCLVIVQFGRIINGIMISSVKPEKRWKANYSRFHKMYRLNGDQESPRSLMTLERVNRLSIKPPSLLQTVSSRADYCFNSSFILSAFNNDPSIVTVHDYLFT